VERCGAGGGGGGTVGGGDSEEGPRVGDGFM
jgi:hypothetical protein